MPNLVGIGNSQVPTNAMLGGLAYQDSVGEINLEKIKARTSDTAKDVFVYDTRKDSDGGAWRHRTQNTSWYNEGVSSKRGARKEFPVVAIIVCLSNHIKIYDGDDPNLPLWMDVRATTNRRDHGWMYGSTLNAVTALNGIIAIASNWNIGDEGGVLIMDFVKDELRRHDSGTSRSGGGLLISQRGTSADLNVAQNVPVIVDPYVYDVAMTVLPNALIDAFTGLPISRIAAATRDGVSVIKDDNTVISTSGSSYIHKVEFTDDHGLNAVISNSSSTNLACVYVNDIDTLNGLAYGTYNNWDGVVYKTKYDPKALTYKTASTNDTISGFIDLENRSSAISVSAIGGGLTLFEKSPKESFDPDDGMVAFITADHNTGWMHGDIKGAFLADTDDTNLTSGNNIVNNGTFNSNTSGWYGDSGAAVSWDSGGFALVTNGGGDNTYAIAQSGILVVGKKYRITGRVNPAIPSGSYEFRVRAGGSGTSWNKTSGLTNGSWYSFDTGVVTADGANLEIGSIGGNITSFYIDDVVVKEFDDDRTNNDNGLEVFGTITKTPVATGAELVAYSGFSNSNYFSQPYNSDLNFGTGDLYIMFWANFTQNDAYDLIMARRAHNGSAYTGNGWYIEMGNDQNIQIKDSVGGTRAQIDPDSVSGVWQHMCFVRRNNVGYGYKNGVLQSNTYAWTENLDNTSAVLTIGRNTASGGGDADKTRLALVRIGAGAPSAQLIKKIYDDEKYLYHKNAKCTLHGTSDDVKALTFDDTTNVLHVGTSSGRSEFKGLNRINNTTTAVTTAISASNGLVAEQ